MRSRLTEIPSTRSGAALALTLAVATVANPTMATSPPRAGTTSFRTSSTSPRDDATRAFQRGTRLVTETKWAEALAAFEEAQTLVPHSVTMFNLGVCERALGRYTAARATFEAALAEDASKRTTLPQRLRQDAGGYLTEINRLLARVKVDITPSSANLTVDGRPVKLAPKTGAKSPLLVAGLLPPGKGEALPSGTFELEMDSGRHVLTFSRPGHTDAVVAKDFAPGRAPALKLTLDEIPATIDISADQPDAIVTVGGRDFGPAPVTVQRPAGQYRVVVEKDGFVTSDTLLDVRAGEAAAFKATLPPEKPSVVKTWWFWTIAAGVVAGAGVGTYFLTREPPEPVRATVGEGTLGWKVPVP
ncbi:MAG: PEGA domain-containing protein [Deltaproteobacteria bacterium]|nr:PEGA domain-containing protein [Deltaproteobacteria bacterium]